MGKHCLSEGLSTCTPNQNIFLDGTKHAGKKDFVNFWLMVCPCMRMTDEWVMTQEFGPGWGSRANVG